MALPGRPHPCLPTPAVERRRLELLLWEGIDSLGKERAERPLIEVLAAADLVVALMPSGSLNEDVQILVRDARRAISDYWNGRVDWEYTLPLLAALADVYRVLLETTPWRRLLIAQQECKTRGVGKSCWEP